VFTNTGTTTCSLQGWPKLAILGPRKLAAVPVHYGTGTNMWVIAATRVRLRPGASAAANVSAGQPLNATHCGYPTWKITPPHGHQSVTLSVRPSPAPGQEPVPPLVCANTGYIVVSAVYPGHRDNADERLAELAAAPRR
jgi:hypothetical protein